ncbi:hypothetical protein LCGC14_0220430 [marine sediment metagenome]|uniref:Uncharacterized protein n=1 Tax=marine sediment metagenome TaxID=412755 RepID=A0A0F9UUK0_9ZZZZ
MTFHAGRECQLIPMSEGGQVRFDIMSDGEHVGGIRFCFDLKEWEIHLNQHVKVTYYFVCKIWDCLLPSK